MYRASKGRTTESKVIDLNFTLVKEGRNRVETRSEIDEKKRVNVEREVLMFFQIHWKIKIIKVQRKYFWLDGFIIRDEEN